MISKLLLPHLGGTPAIWNISMFFFQLILLAGYAYVHYSIAWLGIKKQAFLHGFLLLCGIAVLPLALSTPTDISTTNNPQIWLLVTLVKSVGIPFFLLACNAPLLQYWFANSSHKQADNPYFLYSVSNAGSLIALVGYIIIVEPNIAIPEQLNVWSVIFAVCVAFLLGIAIKSMKYTKANDNTKRISNDHEHIVDEPIGLKRRLYWLLLAFIPSSLMLGVTTYISTDITSTPLIWLIPLTLYLLTFIIAFSSKNENAYERVTKGHVALLAILLFSTFANNIFPMQVALLHLFVFFASAIICHCRLAQIAPSPSHLTSYYLWISIGGVMGGLFNAILAPILFSSSVEYWLMIGLVILVRPQPKKWYDKSSGYLKKILSEIYIPLIFGLGLIAIYYLYKYTNAHYGYADYINNWLGSFLNVTNPFLSISGLIFFIAAIILILKSQFRPVRLFTSMLILFVTISVIKHSDNLTILHQHRNFFGITKVVHQKEKNIHYIQHGTTLHGIESLDKTKTVYSYYNAIADIYESNKQYFKQNPYAIAGLGAGTLIHMASPNQEVDMFEIDPDIIEIAKNPEFFTYLSSSKAKQRFYVGDARLEMRKVDDNRYGLIIIDAFSSDAIPMHLMTKQAFELYESKVKSDGVIAIHISSRYLKLKPIIANIAEELNLSAYYIFYKNKNNKALQTPAKWVVLAKNDEILEPIIKQNADWEKIYSDGDTPWSDDYSNILEAIIKTD